MNPTLENSSDFCIFFCFTLILALFDLSLHVFYVLISSTADTR